MFKDKRKIFYEMYDIFRELHIIINRRETLMSTQHYGATLVSHELAHKWFGNLITCYWWSNTWINEGYASYFGYIATNKVRLKSVLRCDYKILMFVLMFMFNTKQ